MSKLGRPRKTVKETRNIRVEFYLNEDEYALLYEKALDEGKKVSRFCRDKCLSRNHITLGVEGKLLMAEMGKIGVNLNQLVKKINSLKENDVQQASKFLERAKIDEINEAIDSIKLAKNIWYSLNNNVI